MKTLPGRETPTPIEQRHHVFGRPITPPFIEGAEQAVFGMGCFWGAEKKLWQAAHVIVTAVGYAGGVTPNPTYEEVCSGRTGHAEVVLVVFDPHLTSYESMLELFWENHDPTQGMRQGNDVGSQYRSLIQTFDEQQAELAVASSERYAQKLAAAGYPPITTEITPATPFYYAEEYHQQYLSKNPQGYCGLGGTGIRCSERDS